MAWIRCTGNTGGSLKVRTVSGAIASFEANLAEPLQSVKCEINATGGNGTPDNPNPINGYSSANITRCGVNFFDKATVTSGRLINGAGNEVSYSGWNVSDYIPVPEGASLYLNGLTTHPNTLQDNFELFDASKTKIGFVNVRTNEYPWTIPTGTKYVKFSLNDSDLNTAQFSPTNNAPYEPYNGNTYTIAFGQTVYGGVLDVTRGKLTVTHANIASYNGESINEPWLSSMDTYVPNTTPTTGAQVVYPLTTPFDIDFTPVQIEALLGVNNVWHDATGDTEVKYLEVVRN